MSNRVSSVFAKLTVGGRRNMAVCQVSAHLLPPFAATAPASILSRVCRKLCTQLALESGSPLAREPTVVHAPGVGYVGQRSSFLGGPRIQAGCLSQVTSTSPSLDRVECAHAINRSPRAWHHRPDLGRPLSDLGSAGWHLESHTQATQPTLEEDRARSRGRVRRHPYRRRRSPGCVGRARRRFACAGKGQGHCPIQHYRSEERGGLRSAGSRQRGRLCGIALHG